MDTPPFTTGQARIPLGRGLEPEQPTPTVVGSPVPWTARRGDHTAYWIVQAADGEVVCVLPAGPRAEADARGIAAAGSLVPLP